MKRPRTTTSKSIKKNRIPTSLDFNQYSFHESARKKGKNPTKLALDFIDYVEESLNSRSSSSEITCIDEFKIVVKFSRLVREEGDVGIQRWINYAVNNNVKNFLLSYHTNPSYKEGWRYVLPESLYAASSLEKLDLFGCELLKPRLDSGVIRFFSLKKLRLSRVLTDQETLQSLVDGCGFLEELCIELCEGFEVVRVGGDGLEVVDLYLDRDRVQIVAVRAAPNLRRLSYGGGFDGVRGSFMASELGNVKELRFHDVSLEVGFLQQVNQKIPKLELELERYFMVS